MDGSVELSIEQVRTLLAAQYGVRPERVDRLDSELSTVCRIEESGRTLVVKVGTESLPTARWRTAVLADLAASRLPVAGVVPDRDGNLVSTSTVFGVPLTIVVEQWLDGVPLRAADVGEPLLREVGRTAARLSAALASAPPPPVVVTHAWEASRSRASILAARPAIQDPGCRELVTRAADLFATDVEPLLAELPRAVVHQDLHDDNLLVGPAGGRPQVVGILDFGDLLLGLRVAEPAVCAGYAARLTADPLDGFLAVVGGWGQEAALTDVEVAALFPLACVRLAVNVAIWTARSTGTRSAYAAARSARSLPALTAMLAADRRQVAAEVRRRTTR